MSRIAEIHPREPRGRDRYASLAGVIVNCANCSVVFPSLETLEDVLDLRNRHEMVLAPETLRRPAPQIDADAVIDPSGLTRL